MICFIRNRDNYTLRKRLHYFSAFTGKALAALIAVLCISSLCHGQDAGTASDSGEEEIRPLKIGDTIPEALWNTPLQVVNHPEGKDTITLSEYKDKLIILDFWATWCVPCIKGFPKLNKLQNEFGDKIKILSVTQEGTERINAFFNTGAGKEHTYVNSVVDDKVFLKYFPYKTVPHIIWLNQNGTVMNMTSAKEMNEINIQTILEGQKVEMSAKVDIDRNRPLFLSEHFSTDIELTNYSIFIRGYYSGMPSGNKIKKTKKGEVYGRQITNASMMDIYYSILFELFESRGDRFNSRRIIIDVNDPELLNLMKNSDGDYEDDNYYSYELIVPQDNTDSLFYYMLEDLNRYSDYKGSIQKRKVDCLVLVRTSSEDKIKSNGGNRKCTFPNSPSILKNEKLATMINMLGEDSPINLPIIDETQYTGNVDIEIPEISDFNSFREELNKYDLDLLPTRREINMFVIEDK